MWHILGRPAILRTILRNVSTITSLACERLKRGSLGDSTHPGLRIMARPTGAKLWVYRFRDPAGKMAQVLIGSFPALSLADARTEWRNHRATRNRHTAKSGDSASLPK